MPVSKNRRNKSGKNRTSLKQHERQGKTLRPAFSQLENKMDGKLFFSNWTYERLPELLWAAIVRVIDDQYFAINEFRKILSFIKSHPNKEEINDISLSGISRLNPSLQEELISAIISEPKVASALTVLKLFPDFPAKNIWIKLLPNTPPNIEIMMHAIGRCLYHQSQEATDCRWLRIMAIIHSGKMFIPENMVENLLGYPNIGDQHSVRPTIRAMEMTFTQEKTDWPDIFWEECWERTPCLELELSKNKNEITYAAIDSVEKIDIKLMEHWHSTHKTTEIDAKHDCVFGIAFFALRIVKEMIEGSSASGILGRLGLRTILELYITLHYLLKQDDKSLWLKWRKYGSGQAKLNTLRFDEEIIPPKYIDTDVLETISGEDTWEEFLDIELGNWTNLDLRKLSINCNLKELYDKYYSWPSGFSHGHWGAIRESNFTTCGNPLHRLHRYPNLTTLPNVIFDVQLLVNLILDDCDKAYSGLTNRLDIEFL